MIDKGQPLSVSKQCGLPEANRSSVYYRPAPVPREDLEVVRTG